MDIDVIFLDIDGVLNPSEGNHSHIFAPECVAEMHRTLERLTPTRAAGDPR